MVRIGIEAAVPPRAPAAAEEHAGVAPECPPCAMCSGPMQMMA
jgi:hypothetical protein